MGLRLHRFSGITSVSPSCLARHHFAAGHNRHTGARGVQTVAPNSITV